MFTLVDYKFSLGDFTKLFEKVNWKSIPGIRYISEYRRRHWQ